MRGRPPRSSSSPSVSPALAFRASRCGSLAALPSGTTSGRFCSIRNRKSPLPPKLSCSWRRARNWWRARSCLPSSKVSLSWSIGFSFLPTPTRSLAAVCRKTKFERPTVSPLPASYRTSLCYSMSRLAKAWVGRTRVARVGNAFREFADQKWQHSHPECGPIKLIDGTGDENTVQHRIVSALMTAFPQPFGNLKS